MKTIKRILLILILTAVGMVPVSAHMFSGNNWTWLYSDSEVSVYLGRYYYDVDRDQLSCWDIDTRLKILAGLNLQHLIIITKNI